MIMNKYNDRDTARRIAECETRTLTCMNEAEMYRFILSVIDLTSLEGSDNKAKIDALCQTAIAFGKEDKVVKSPAAVCVYPPFVAQAKQQLVNTDIKVASVAGAFPAGQSPIEIKVAEVRYAVAQGADEIDMVISRGKFLEGRFQEVADEIVAVKKACGNALLKVILETGELQTADNIYMASMLAMESGADFIKTSTGKITVNATPEAFLVMMDAIADFYRKTSKKVGIKAAGGISDPETAVLYVKLLAHNLGDEWLNKSMFRIGTSRLAPKIFLKINC